MSILGIIMAIGAALMFVGWRSGSPQTPILPSLMVMAGGALILICILILIVRGIFAG